MSKGITVYEGSDYFITMIAGTNASWKLCVYNENAEEPVATCEFSDIIVDLPIKVAHLVTAQEIERARIKNDANVYRMIGHISFYLRDRVIKCLPTHVQRALNGDPTRPTAERQMDPNELLKQLDADAAKLSEELDKLK